MGRHPIQPLGADKHGTMRFRPNAIVQYLLDAGPFDMNHLAVQNFTDTDREQFAQLIGYSLGGFGSLDYVSEETYRAAERMAQGEDERDAQIAALEAMLARVREGLRIATTAVFHIHPDDLTPAEDDHGD